MNIKSIKEVSNRYKFWGTLEFSLFRILGIMRIWILHMDIFIFEINHNGHTNIVKGAIFRELTDREHASTGKYPLRRSSEKEIIEHPDRSFGFIKDGEVIATISVRFDQFDLPPYNLLEKFPNNQVYIYDVYVRPQYRRQGFGQELYRQTGVLMGKEGKSELRIFIDHYNYASRHCVKDIGGYKIKTFWIWKINRSGIRCREK